MERRQRGKLSTDTTARVVRYVLDQRHLSQAELAETLEVSESFISRSLSGERNLTIDHLQMIEDKFDMPIGAMFLAISKPGTDPKYARLRELARELMVQGDRVSAAVKAAARRRAAGEPASPKRATA